MFLGQDAVMEPVDEVSDKEDWKWLVEKCPIREQKDRPSINLGEVPLEDDYSEDSFPL